MNETVKSPLIRGKPAWIVGLMRLYHVYFGVNIILLAGLYLSDESLGETGQLVYAGGMILWVFGFQLVPIRRIKSYGISFWKMRSFLEHIEGVPCPNCLYPLCQIRDADQDHVCSECGCGINGVDALRAWDNVRGYHRPQSWVKWLNAD